jgi:hypothetical protein
MSVQRQLLAGVFSATLITVAGWLIIVFIGLRAGVTHTEEELLGAIAIFIPIVVGSWLLFRRVRLQASAREARATVSVFALSAPASLIVAIPIANIPGSYGSLLGRPFGMIGAVACVVTLMTLISFAACSLAVRMVRRRDRLRPPP